MERLPVAAQKELCRVLFEQISVIPRTRFRRPKRHRGRFEVRMTVDSREKFIGSYETMAKAIEVRNAKYAELGIPVTDDNNETLRGWLRSRASHNQMARGPSRGRYFLHLI